MNQPKPPAVPRIDDNLDEWHTIAENLEELHPSLHDIAAERLQERGIEISREHHEEHVEVARPVVPDIDSLSPAEQDFIGEVIEIGHEAVEGNRPLGTEQETATRSLKELVQQAQGNPELWNDEAFVAELNALTINTVEAAIETPKISSKEIKELRQLGIIMDADKPTKKIFDCKLTPGPLVMQLIHRFGIEKAPFLAKSWGSEVSIERQLQRIGRHLRTLESVHQKDSSAPKELFERFGIIHFGRYTPEQLTGQLDLVRSIKQGDEKPQSIIAVVAATGDHNGVMDHMSPQKEHLNAIKARETDPTAPPVVFIEADLPERLGDTLQSLGSETAPISALFITAHGDNDILHLSSQGGGYIEGTGSGLLGNFSPEQHLTPGAEICLNSCSTGPEYGVADQLSERLGRRVYATSKPSYNNAAAFTFEKNKNGEWHYVFGFTHDGKIRKLEQGHVFGGPEMLEEMAPSSAELTWRGVKKIFRPGRPVKPSYISRMKHRRNATRPGTRKFNIND